MANIKRVSGRRHQGQISDHLGTAKPEAAQLDGASSRVGLTCLLDAERAKIPCTLLRSMHGRSCKHGSPSPWCSDNLPECDGDLAGGRAGQAGPLVGSSRAFSCDTVSGLGWAGFSRRELLSPGFRRRYLPLFFDPQPTAARKGSRLSI